MLLADLLCRAQPFVGVRRRHPDVHDRHVRLVRAHLQHQLVRVAGLPDDVEAAVLEQPRDPLAQQDRVVGEDDAHLARFLRLDPERRELLGEAGRDDLEEPLGLGQPVQLVLAEVLQLDAAGQLDVRRVGHEDLAAVAGLRDPRRPVHVEADVVAVLERRLARVDADSDAELDPVLPRVSRDGALRLEGRLERARSLVEGGEHLVAAAVDLPPAGPLDRLAHEAAVVRDQPRVGPLVLAEDPRRALDVREEEGDSLEAGGPILGVNCDALTSPARTLVNAA